MKVVQDSELYSGNKLLRTALFYYDQKPEGLSHRFRQAASLFGRVQDLVVKH